MTIYDIKYRTLETAPHFFTRSSMKFFGQTLKSFNVNKQPDGRFRISAPMIDKRGTYTGDTVRYFNPITNMLDHE
jgi:hypothetical protein